jgi:hypothetical protein
LFTLKFKVLLLSFFIASLLSQANAQVTNKGVIIKVPSGVSLTVSGPTNRLTNSDAATIEISAGATLIADEDVYNESLSTLLIDGTLDVNGDFENNALASVAGGGGAGIVEFSGSASQDIGGSSTTVFENLRINNTTGVTMSATAQVSVGLSFFDGIITKYDNRFVMTNTDVDGVSG